MLMFKTLAISTFAAAALGVAAPAFAGECPANQMRAGATKPVTTAAKGVTDKVLSQIDLAGEKLALKGHLMRVRKLEIQPGGIVPWHSHEDRPALIYVVSGQIHEYASNCAVPIEHKSGEVSIEKLGVQHWWKNTGKTPAVLLSSDVFHEMRKEDEHMM
jgi:quercetin dioxygenase-like cupin family protein